MLAIESSDSPVRTLARYVDLAVLAAALPVFLAGGEPLGGWIAIAIAWPAQRAFQALMEAKAEQAEDAKGFFRFIAGSLVGRAWILAIAIFAIGIIDRPSGLAAALLAAVVFTSYLIASLIFRPEAPK